MSKEQFELCAALKGKELIIRDERPARYIAILQNCNPEFPLLVEVLQNPMEKQINKQHWVMENYTIKGKLLPPFDQPEDLFIRTL